MINVINSLQLLFVYKLCLCKIKPKINKCLFAAKEVDTAEIKQRGVLLNNFL